MGEPNGGRLFLGVDGGASKTRAIVVSESGALLARAECASSSAYHRQPEEAAAVVVSAAREALHTASATAPVMALGAGLAGADEPTVRLRLTQVLREAGLARHVSVDHDAAAALAGGTALEPGVVIIAGTGSVAFGIDATGRRARAGGWGPLLDDEGSGYAVARAALRAAMRAFDGRGPETALTSAIAARFGLSSLVSLKMAVRTLGIDEIASLAPLAVDAAHNGDDIAIAILARAGEALAAMVMAVAETLDWRHESFPLVTTGGMFEAGSVIRRPMMEALDAHACPARPGASRFPPEVGAALLAARAAGSDAASMIARLSTRA